MERQHHTVKTDELAQSISLPKVRQRGALRGEQLHSSLLGRIIRGCQFRAWRILNYA